MADNAIELRGVSKRYGQGVALQPLDLDIHEGEFFCLLGPSGCGKTTTLNVIGGFVTPSSGTIEIRGADVTRLPPHRRPVNTVFQSYALFPHLSVLDNVAFGLRMERVGKAERRRQASESLDLVGLSGFGGRATHELSGGQAQRVAIARALVKKPAVLLLDEPLGALDLKLRKRLQVELSLIHRQVGTTFVYVTHDQEEAMALANRIAVMDGGEVKQIGSPEEIYLRPTSRFVADFIGESNIIPGRIDEGRFLAYGTTPVPCASAPAASTVLIVRPESVTLGLVDPAAGGLVGTVADVAFLGLFRRITVALDGRDEYLVVVVQSDGGVDAGSTPGDRVSLTWRPDAAIPLIEEPNERRNE